MKDRTDTESEKAPGVRRGSHGSFGRSQAMGFAMTASSRWHHALKRLYGGTGFSRQEAGQHERLYLSRIVAGDEPLFISASFLIARS